jgi:hypothetical protein
MPARTPEELPQLFAEAFGHDDLEAVMELYEPDATRSPLAPSSLSRGVVGVHGYESPSSQPIDGASSCRETRRGTPRRYWGAEWCQNARGIYPSASQLSVIPF